MNWPEVTIASVCETSSGGTPSRENQGYYGGSIPWVKSGELRENVITDTEETITAEAVSNSSAKILPPGTLLIAMYGATVGRMATLGVEAATNQAVCAFTPRNGNIDERFLFHSLQRKIPELLNRRIGGAQPNISQGIIRSLKIRLPPLGEQKRIAAILDKAEAIRRKREQAIKLADEFLRSLFLDMLGDPVSNPKGWPVEPLAKLIAAGPQNGLYRPSSDYGSGTPIVRIDSFDREGSFEISSLKRLRISEEIQAIYGLQQNDLLINRVNSRSHLGKSALVPALSEPVVFESNMMRLRLKEDLLQPTYAMHFLRTSRIKRQIQASAKDAVNQASINQSDVLSLEFLLPPLSDQIRFREISSRLDALRRRLSSWAGIQQQLNFALSQRAFQGEP